MIQCWKKRERTPLKTLTISTKKKDEVIDLTDTIEHHLQTMGPEDGLCSLFLAHTTCGLTTADLDPGTDQDLLDALRRLLPKMSYRHPHDPQHAPDHILSSMLGSSLTIPYIRRQLLLGTWQRVILVELDGPRRRTLHMSCFEG